jgi:quinol---cytochrome c reductase iron-sulfur subunit, bacillus type
MPNRRDLFRLGAIALGNLFALALAVPGVKYLLDPLGKKPASGEFHPLTRLGQLKVGEPRSFAIIAERRDAWIKYPKEPIGSVWLVRQPEGSKEPVLAFTAECPHLSCPVNLAPDRKTFLCPCHQANFTFDGKKINEVAARGMDSLTVEFSGDTDPEVRVKFERFQPQSAEKKPLV